ncbi:hypothetical protein [Sphingomonas sp. TX0522]|uniref:hypothetical protein n=1 Tax=Sphingomonas sp. TX0522 TaxID=2479205 RepID=UPI0018E03FF6|nr:hypothetical protein [Sphingomonas sp. TX0522]MBI0530066.1 hypothetical protein [Sphingomonas sp. TX0522]
MTPFTCSVEQDGAEVRLSVLLSTDPGPVREFRPFLDVTLDEAHAIMLFGELGLALQAISDAKNSGNVTPLGRRR